jgi:hypothetical protein
MNSERSYEASKLRSHEAKTKHKILRLRYPALEHTRGSPTPLRMGVNPGFWSLICRFILL